MFHLVARAAPGTVLFRDWFEGFALWDALVRAFPELVALCVMPDHVHLILPHDDPGGKLGVAMSAYARWRNARRGRRGAVWAPHPPPKPIPDDGHLTRTLRYTALNPCRKRLVADPLGWPLSTHRDSVGFAAPPVVAAERDPARWQRYVSGDPTVAIEGTPLPATRYDDVAWSDVRDAVAGVCRVHPDALRIRGRPRTLALQTAWYHGLRDRGLLTAHTGIRRVRLFETVRGVPGRGADVADPALEACIRATGDPRFGALSWGDLLRTSAWARYRDRR